MEIFKEKNSTLEPVNQIQFKLEKDIQKVVEQNVKNLFNLEFIATEVTVGSYRIDSLCFDIENNSFVIIEYKKGSSYSVIDQGYTYLQLLLNNKADFLLIYSEFVNKVVKSSDIDWSQSKIIFISPSFNSYQKDSVNFKGLPFELWEIAKYQNNLVSLNQHQTSSNEKISSITSSQNEKIETVNKEIIQFEESDHTKKYSKDLINNWENFKSLILLDDNVNMKISQRYISFTLGNSRKTIAYFNSRSNGFKIHIVRGFIRRDGKETKKFLTLDDPKKMAKEITWKYLDDIQHAYEIMFDKDTDVDYLIFLIKQQLKKMQS
jgi:hypothetical protein